MSEKEPLRPTADQPFLQETVEIEPFAFSPTLAGRLRRWWYGIAARWGVQSIMEQQNRINRIQREHTHTYFDHLRALDRELSEAKRQIALLNAKVKKLEEEVERR